MRRTAAGTLWMNVGENLIFVAKNVRLLDVIGDGTL